MQLTEAYVDSLALNAGAIKNGKDLAKKQRIHPRRMTEDGKLLFGECAGSGSTPYSCSADFWKEGEPVFRCSCPSRQFPCKHTLGLLYAYAQGQAFETAPLPDDIADKREKVEKREEKREEKKQEPAADTPKRKTSASALAKKVQAQLAGFDLLEKLLVETVQTGLAGLDAKTIRTLEAKAKELGNHYIPGVQAALREWVLLLREEQNAERRYTRAVEELTRLYALLRKGRAYLEAKAADPAAASEEASALEEAIGRAWQLAELRELGFARRGRELAQLGFRSYADDARGEYVDEGYWIDLAEGGIRVTRTYRPYRAAKFIKEDDSYFEVLQPGELFVYPGEGNPRIRWEEAVSRPLTADDLAAIRSRAIPSVAEAVKQAKNQLKSPLADRHPVLLVASAEFRSDGTGATVLADAQGKLLRLGDLPDTGRATTPLVPLLAPECLREAAVLLRFGHDIEQDRLTAQPLSLVTASSIVRLLY